MCTEICPDLELAGAIFSQSQTRSNAHPYFPASNFDSIDLKGTVLPFSCILVCTNFIFGTTFPCNHIGMIAHTLASIHQWGLNFWGGVCLRVGHGLPYQMLHWGPVTQDMLPLGYPFSGSDFTFSKADSVLCMHTLYADYFQYC